MMARWTERMVVGLLLTAVAVNAVLLVWVRATAGQRSSVSVARPGAWDDKRVEFEAFVTAGKRLPEMSQGRGGWAVRYVAKSCGYSESDTHGKRLSGLLAGAGVPVVLLLPRAGEELAGDGVTPGGRQVAFAPIEWIKRYRLTKTPTFLLFGPRGTLIWYHQGTLVAEDVTKALQALRVAQEP